jgi:DNA-binding NarL/FixJ family response regulator
MNYYFAKPSEAKVHVVEPQVALRSVIVEALRVQGFVQISAFGDLKTLMDRLSAETSDWIVAAPCLDGEVNIMHLLNICIEEPRLRKTKVSLMIREHEKDILPFAFEWGLLSYHNVTLPSRIADDIADLLRVLRSVSYNCTLAAANFLNRVLKEKRQWDAIINCSKNLLEVFPGSPHVLLNMAEAELSSCKEEGKQTLKQVLLLDPGLAEVVELVAQRFALDEEMETPLDLEILALSRPINNALGLASCVVIDPDTDVHFAIRQTLSAAGVQNIETFETGESAWHWLINGPPPSLILMEWRIPDLNGLQLIQRIQNRFPSVNIIIVSSLVTQKEEPLLQELGVKWVVEKPFDIPTILRKIVTAVQQYRYPTEQDSMDIRIRHSLSSNSREEASRLVAVYLSQPNFHNAGKIRVQAEFAFFEGRFKDCCNVAYEALKLNGDSVDLLNLLGKALMKLGDFENALRIFEKANVLAPKNIERICNMVCASSGAGHAEKAEDLLAEAKAIDSRNTLVMETEASLAIELHDQERASSTMQNVESFNRIVAYINNKAVAKIRNEQFEEGIRLYATALESLPEPWGATHDTVCFNLALAKIRYLRYSEALEVLNRTKANPSSIMGQKVAALQSKLKTAIETNAHLHFSVEKNPKDVVDKSEIENIDISKMIDALVPARGDMCCYRIFQADDLADPGTRKLLDNRPRLVVRPMIHRDDIQAPR